jgi:methionyl-tRNA formyltransferase
LWALYEGGNLGVSAYLLNDGIDTGPIIKNYKVNKSQFKSVDEYIKLLKDLKLNSYLDAIKKYKSNNFENYHPKISKHQNRGLMSLKKIKELVKKINKKN